MLADDGQRLINGLFESIETFVPETLAVDKNRGGAFDADVFALIDVALDFGDHLGGIHHRFEFCCVETELAPDLIEQIVVQAAIICKDAIVDRPEFALCMGGLGRIAVAAQGIV